MFFRAALKRLAGGIILASALTAAPAMAQQGVPQGSYLESCRQVQVRWGKDLAAFCATRAGEWVVSRLDDFPSCGGDIANRNGQLVCRDMPAPGSLYGTLAPPPPARPQPPAPPPVVQRPPAGTYTSSCRDLKLEGSWLSATCRDGWGNWREAGLSLTGCPLGADIANVEGRLACRSFTSQHAGDYPPPGSYQETCRDVSLESGTLRGTCLSRRGAWLSSSLYLSWCSNREVVNDDGILRCASAVSSSASGWNTTPAPYGSYRSTCRDVTVSGGFLRAMCQDRGGTWRTSIPLQLAQCLQGADIYNDNSDLRCSRAGSSGFSDRPPPGSYMASCRDIRVVAGWLKASCQDRNGRWSEATTAVSWCSPGRDIANDNGRLTCR